MTHEPARWLWAVGAAVLWLVLTGFIVWRERRAKAAARAQSDAMAGDGESVLVAFASQTGFAEQLAWHNRIDFDGQPDQLRAWLGEPVTFEQFLRQHPDINL